MMLLSRTTSFRTATLAICSAFILPFSLRGSTLQSIEASAAQWAKLRAETARIESDWSWEREILNSTQLALRERLKLLQERKTLLNARHAASRTELLELEKQLGEGATALAEIEEQTESLIERVVSLRSGLPPRLSAALDLPYRSIVDRSMTFAQRVQHLTSILNRCALFNQSVHRSEEVVVLSNNNESRMLEIAYWGLSQAYALDRSRQKAYVGYSTGTGWQWNEAPEIVTEVDQILKIQEGSGDPAFAALPVRIMDVPFAGSTANANR